MSATTVPIKIDAELWLQPGDFDHDHESSRAAVEVARDGDPNEITLHTFVDGRGSLVSYVFNREDALRLAARLLDAVALEDR